MATKKSTPRKVLAVTEDKLSPCTNKLVIQNAPPWANYFAVDQDGCGYYYQNRPELDESEASWLCKGGESDGVSSWVESYRTSLVELPNKKYNDILHKKELMNTASREDLITLLQKFIENYGTDLE